MPLSTMAGVLPSVPGAEQHLGLVWLRHLHLSLVISEIFPILASDLVSHDHILYTVPKSPVVAGPSGAKLCAA